MPTESFTIAQGDQLFLNGRRVVPRVAGQAVAAFLVAHGLPQAFEGKIAESVSLDELPDLLHAVGRGDELLFGRRINPVIAGGHGRRATDPHMNLFRPRFPYDAHDLAAGCSANDGIIHQHNPLPRQQASDRVELQLDAEIPNRLAGLDEGPSHVVVADEAEAHGNSGFVGKAHGGGHAGVRHRHHEVGFHRMLAPQKPPQHFPALLDRAAKHHAVRPGEVDVLEDALDLIIVGKGHDPDIEGSNILCLIIIVPRLKIYLNAIHLYPLRANQRKYEISHFCLQFLKSPFETL